MMTDITREILEKYQIRKTRKQKTEFIEFMKSKYPALQVETGGFGGNRNIVIGDISSAKVVMTAHYDTCAVLPFPNFLTPKNIFVYLLYNVLVMIPMFAVMFGVSYLTGIISDSFAFSYFSTLAVLGVMMYLLTSGPANKHTVNDNTSGVVTLCEIMAAMDDETLSKTAFVFFDNEEQGLLGSSAFRKAHKQEMKDKFLINLDCVSDGDNIMLIFNKAGKSYETALKEAFCVNYGKNILFERSSNTLYPSDQAGFNCAAAIAAFNRHKIFGLYVDKIHTPRDTVFDEININVITESLVKFAQKL